MSAAGQKHDQGKTPWDLVPWAQVADVARVLQYGAKKYAPGGWKKVPNARDRYFAAAMRHILAWYQGERIDAESKLPHLAHAATNLLFLAWFDAGLTLAEAHAAVRR